MKEAAQKISELIDDKHSSVDDATLQGWLSILLDSAKRLAQTQIDQSAATTGSDAKKLADAAKEMAAAQDEIVKGQLPQAIDHYGNAWKNAVDALK